MTTRKKPLTLRQYMDQQPRGVYDYHIAADLGMSPSMLSRILSGHRVPKSIRILAKLKERNITLEG